MEIKYNKITTFEEKPQQVKIIQFDGDNIQEILDFCYSNARRNVYANKERKEIELQLSQGQWQVLETGNYIIREPRADFPYLATTTNDEKLRKYLGSFWKEVENS
jgi:hypothetical protein